MHGKTVHWGICSAGNICKDFTGNLVSLPKEEHQVKAVASSSLERSQVFAKTYEIPRAYGSYKELANDPDLDIIYIGSLNTQHFEQAKLMLEAGKNVLCEKPLCMSVKDAKFLCELAKKKNVFLMEAIWSRCSPVYDEVLKVIGSGGIGEIKLVHTTFGLDLPRGRSTEKKLGGGALFDIGLYTLQFSQYIFKEYPEEMNAVGFLNDDGIDVADSITFKYSKQRISTMDLSLVADCNNEAVIYGTKGVIRVHEPFWSPNAVTVNGELKKFPLPKVKAPMLYPNSQGLSHEAREVRRCLLNNEKECPRVTHEMTLELAKITEVLRKQLGYTLPHDDK